MKAKLFAGGSLGGDAQIVPLCKAAPLTAPCFHRFYRANGYQFRHFLHAMAY
jgi:hypothetical protein